MESSVEVPDSESKREFFVVNCMKGAVRHALNNGFEGKMKSASKTICCDF